MKGVRTLLSIYPSVIYCDFGSVTSASLNLNFFICKWEKNDNFLDELPVLLSWSSHILSDLG